MALIDLWNTDKQQIVTKRIDQLIAYAGEGRLLDGNTTSIEYRALLKAVTSDQIGKWIKECFENKFSDSGFVLQDAINEIGRRLDFDVSHGYYRSHSHASYDGLWKIGNDRAIIVESKSSTTYTIQLNRISEYRKQVAPQLGIKPEDISILVVVGSEDTSEFEAQVRGSRFAWDVRILGVHALFRLLMLKESLDDPKVEQQIQNLLFPQEFTRLDGIIDLVFATAEDVQDNIVKESEVIDASLSISNKIAAANFHGAIIPKLEKHFGSTLTRVSRSLWSNPQNTILISCRVSKLFESTRIHYWFGLKRVSREILENHPQSYCAFGLGTPDKVVLLPTAFLTKYIDTFFTSEDEDSQVIHWHIRFMNSKAGVALLVDGDKVEIEVSQYILTT